MYTFIIALGVLITLLGLLYKIIKDYNKKRPTKIGIKELYLHFDEVEMYVGKDVEGYDHAKSINNKISKDANREYIDIVTDPNRLSKMTLLYPGEHLLPNNNHVYMLVNLCTKNDIVDKDNIILAFGVLNIKLDIDSDKISKLKIHSAYSMRAGNRSFGRGLKIDIEFNNRAELKSPIEILVAYAYTKNMATSLYMPAIYNRKYIQKDTTPRKLDLLKPGTNVEAFVGFSETAYLFKYKTHSNFLPYYYSFFISKSNRMINSYEEMQSSDLFYTKARNAKSLVGYDIIQKSVKKKW